MTLQRHTESVGFIGLGSMGIGQRALIVERLAFLFACLEQEYLLLS